MVDRTKYSPSIDTAFFPHCKSEWYWSSTPAAYSPGGFAWGVGFGNGYSDWFVRYDEFQVRAVRAP